MEEKKKATLENRFADRDIFNNVGFKSSDIYYINEDKKAAAQAALKGGSRAVAENLRSKYIGSIDDRKKMRDVEN